jgi:hypothetical protein
VRLWHLLLILLAAFVALVLAVGATPVGQEWLTTGQGMLDDLIGWIRGQLT